MPADKSKASPNSKPDKSKKSSELRDDELRKVSGGLASTGGTSTVPDKCISQS
jgi:hypothetical protein